MNEEMIFAVVDIEATSGSVGTGEGMIQFACVLWQDGKVLQTFETLVNPLKKVPRRIQDMTGIRQKEVDSAPLFEEIADLIHDILEDTVFVAHNVSFDYLFINEQLEKVGRTPLKMPAVDTVALARILYPKAPSYNLKDLVEWLGYELTFAHNALYDAEATAFLLDKLIAKAKTLPLVTLEQLSKLAPALSYSTGKVFKYILENSKQYPRDLDESLFIVNQLALKKPEEIETERMFKTDYPYSEEEKKSYFGQNFKLRENQGELMNALHSYFEKDSNGQELAVEAPSGVGKSIGYLFPSLFSSKREEPIVISTYTHVLQNQLLHEAVPLLEKFLPFNVSAVMMKGRENYLSLSQFEQELVKVSSQESEAFYCMQILVWLTETHSGDLEEIGIDIKKTHPFWNRVSTKTKAVPLKGKIASYEFYDRMLEQAGKADFIITNHAYLAHDLQREERTIPASGKLIVDEAHHFVRSLNQAAVHTVKNSVMRNLLKRLGNAEAEESLLSLLQDFADQEVIKQYQVKAVESNSHLLEEEWYEFIGYFDEYLTAESALEVGWEEVWIEEFNITMKKSAKRIKQVFEEILFYLQNILENLEMNFQQLVLSQLRALDDLFDFTEHLRKVYADFTKLFHFSDENQLRWVTFHTKSPEFTLQFKMQSSQEKNRLLKELHEIPKVVYISSTLSVNDSVAFFEKQVQAEELDFIQFPSPYDYSRQSKLIVPNSLKPIKKMPNRQYVTQVTLELEEILGNLNRKTLVLFHSKEILQAVYHRLGKHHRLDDHLLLAQDISGSKTKILKQFKKADQAILFGADSFFEGLDLPGQLLEVVILTKLPFDSPDIPIVKTEHNQLKKKGQNIFMEDLLPRAVLKTKQAFGRLIRSKDDKGVFIVLDDRFVRANYAGIFQESLPEDTEIEFVDLEEVGLMTEEFLKETNEE